MQQFHRFQSGEISKFIHNIYSFTTKENERHQYNCLPCIYPMVSFLFKAELTHKGQKIKIEHSSNPLNTYLILPYSKPLEIDTNGPLKEITIVFKPFCLHRFRFEKQATLKQSETFISLNEIFDKEFLIHLSKKNSTEEQISLIEAFLSKQITEEDHQIDLLDDLPERSYYRKFKQLSYLSPKQFSKIIQMRNSLNESKKNQKIKLTEIAYQNEFADQAHFSRTCKEMSKLSPKQIINNFIDLEKDALWYKS